MAVSLLLVADCVCLLLLLLLQSFNDLERALGTGELGRRAAASLIHSDESVSKRKERERERERELGKDQDGGDVAV